MGNVKIGVNAWSYPSGMNLPEMFSHAKRVGYELLNLWLMSKT